MLSTSFFHKSVAKATRYLPIKPGANAAFFAGIIQWLIRNRRDDVKYLVCANKAAATEAGEPTWTNATWLAKVGAHGTPCAGLFLHRQNTRNTKSHSGGNLKVCVGEPLAGACLCEDTNYAH